MQIRVILQIAADTAAICNGLNAQPLQFVGGANARAQQYGWRMNGPGANNDFPRIDLRRLPISFDDGADGAHTLETQLRDARVRHDRKIGPLAYGRRQITAGAGRSRFRILTHGHREKPVARILIDVGHDRQAVRDGRMFQRGDETRPLVGGGAADGIGPGRALALVPVEIVFSLAKIFDHVAPAPAFRAGLRPGIEIGRHAAQRDETHHARTAAHDPRLGKGMLRTTGKAGRFKFRPEIIRIQRGAWKRVDDIRGRRVGRRVGPGFDE
jgi:hypothetical protein